MLASLAMPTAAKIRWVDPTVAVSFGNRATAIFLDRIQADGLTVMCMCMLCVYVVRLHGWYWLWPSTKPFRDLRPSIAGISLVLAVVSQSLSIRMCTLHPHIDDDNNNCRFMSIMCRLYAALWHTTRIVVPGVDNAFGIVACGLNASISWGPSNVAASVTFFFVFHKRAVSAVQCSSVELHVSPAVRRSALRGNQTDEYIKIRMFARANAVAERRRCTLPRGRVVVVAADAGPLTSHDDAK